MNLPKFAIDPSASNALWCIKHGIGDEPFMTKSRGQDLAHYNASKLVHAVHYEPPERLDKKWTNIIQ